MLNWTINVELINVYINLGNQYLQGYIVNKRWKL